jgi:mannan endo-1,4-beta-mannosidase
MGNEAAEGGGGGVVSHRRALVAVLVALVALMPLTACGDIASRVAHEAASQGTSGAGQAAAKVPPVSGKLVGYTTPNFPHDMATFTALEGKVGEPADIASWYTSMGMPFDPVQVRKINMQGIFPVIEIDSDATPVTQIIDGKWDVYFTTYARAVAKYSSPIAIDFDHEFNGPWFDWGYEHTTPADFVAAWRHVVSLFRANGATNVTWIWNPGADAAGTVVNLSAWYPGASYVTWVGLDGYFLHAADTFDTVFTPTLSKINAFTRKPVLIVETGAGPNQVSQIRSLFTGLAETSQVIGFIWFDYDRFSGHDWVIDNDRPALAALHTGIAAYRG